MSQQTPFDNQGFVPPPPPPPASDSPNSLEELAIRAESASKNARKALITGIIGLLCLGFIFGALAIGSAVLAIETIETYKVAQDKRSMAIAGMVLGAVDIIVWLSLLINGRLGLI